MDKQEWLACRNPVRLLDLINPGVSSRKTRLFLAACCRRFSFVSQSPLLDYTLKVVEEFADGTHDPKEWSSVCGDVSALYSSYFEENNVTDVIQRLLGQRLPSTASLIVPLRQARLQMLHRAAHRIGCPSPAVDLTEPRAMCELVHDIFGNPFRPVAFDPAWRSEAAVGIARGIYDDRAFERMPILADALQEAGCETEDVLSHCREPGVHVRGCWVVDLVLGKG